MVDLKKCIKNILSQLLALMNKFNLIKDYIVEEGSINGWYYKKYNSGQCECYKKSTSITCTHVQVWNGLYQSNATIQLPFAISNGISFISLQIGTGYSIPQGIQSWSGSKTKITINGLGSQQDSNGTYYGCIKGKWK